MSKAVGSLSGKVALVTGGGRGVGRVTAELLTRNGVTVVLEDVDDQLAAQTAEDIGQGTRGWQLDVADHAAFAAVIGRVGKEGGPLDILINNAGIMPIGPFEAEFDAMAHRVLEVNLHAMLWSTKYAIRLFKASNTYGHVVHVSSGGGWVAGAGGATYSACKHGVVGFSYAVDQELRGTEIDISVVAPTVVQTDLGAGLADTKFSSSVTSDQVAAAIVEGLRRPRFVICVPKTMGVLALLMSGLPYGARTFMTRISKADAVLAVPRSCRTRRVREEPPGSPPGNWSGAVEK